MSQADKIKWNKKYKDTPFLLEDRQASSKLISIIKDTKGKKALEIACGSGRNSIYMADNGFIVEALDISDIALENLNNKKIDTIITKQVDLEEYIPKEDSYDLIVKTNYLNRKLIPHLAKALKKDGLLLIETYMHHKDNTKPMSNPDFLLKKDELKEFFKSEKYEVVEYQEFDNEPEEMYKMKKQSIIIRNLTSTKQ